MTSLAALAAAASVTRAESAPTQSPSNTPSVQAWLDAQVITPDAPPGGVLEGGVTFWNPVTNDFAVVDEVFARLPPGERQGPRLGGTPVSVTAAAGDQPTTAPESTAPPPSEDGVPVIAWLVVAALLVGLFGVIA